MREQSDFNFSIIIPTYNNLELFKDALDSVLCQNDVSVEIIVTDDSKTVLIQNYCNNLSVQSNFKMKYVHNIPSLGAVKNWNSGIQMATGDNIVVLHHDERFPDENYLKELNAILQNNDIVISNIEVHDGKRIKKNWIPVWIKKLQFRFPESFFLINSIGPCACIAIKKEKIKSFDSNLVWLVDCEWYYRLFSNKNKFEYLDYRHIISQNRHDDKITNNINVRINNLKDLRILVSKYKCDIKVRLFLILNKVKSKTFQ